MTNDWAMTQRNNQAIRVAVALAVVLFFALIYREDSNTFLRTEQVLGTITAIKVIEREGHSRFSGSSTSITYRVHLALENNKQLKFMLFQVPPKVGTKVPVIVDMFDDGKNYYHYSLIEWQLLK